MATGVKYEGTKNVMTLLRARLPLTGSPSIRDEIVRFFICLLQFKQEMEKKSV